MRIGIHGLGRVGRSILRASLVGDLDVVGINDYCDEDNLLYLARYDSVHGTFPVPIDQCSGG